MFGAAMLVLGVGMNFEDGSLATTRRMDDDTHPPQLIKARAARAIILIIMGIAIVAPTTTHSARNDVLPKVMGTFMLVFTGCGAVIVNDLYGGGLGHLGINIVFGLVVMAVVYSLGNVSGAHINPAVTIGFYAAKRFPANLLLPYIASQFGERYSLD